MTSIQAERAVAQHTNIHDQLQTAMQAVEDAMYDVVDSKVDVLRDASNHILSAGGKRVRPRLLMLSYMANGGADYAYAAKPAAAVELMHTASVVHDDINDHGVLRRGRPSVNAIWGRTFALLTGDFLFTSVYELMASYNDLNIVLARAATALVEGETLQAWAVKNSAFTSEMYNRIIGLKTAALFEAAGEMGARLAGSNERTVRAFKQYAYKVGLAFQIVDDILDIVGDEAKLGKTAGIDIEQGRGFAAVQDAETSTNGHGHPQHHTEDIMDSIKRKLMAGDRLPRARMLARTLVEEAVQALDVLPNSDAKDELIALAYLVINRDH